MTLSLPVSAFQGIDDDNNGQLSQVEFQKNQQHIANAVLHNVTLTSDNKTLPLKGLLMSPAISHHSQSKEAKQIIIMGKFFFENTNKHNFNLLLYGNTKPEQLFKISVTNKETNYKLTKTVNLKKTSIEITPASLPMKKPKQN